MASPNQDLNEVQSSTKRHKAWGMQDQSSTSPTPSSSNHRRKSSIQLLFRPSSRSSQVSPSASDRAEEQFTFQSPLLREASTSSPSSSASSRSAASTSQHPIGKTSSLKRDHSSSSQQRPATTNTPRPPARDPTPPHADRTPQRAHRPPPNSWLSRSSSKTLGRRRSGSLGANEELSSPSSSRYSARSDILGRTLSSSSSSMSERQSSNGSPSRPRSGTWSRLALPGNRRDSAVLEDSSLSVHIASPTEDTSAPPYPSSANSDHPRRANTLDPLPSQSERLDTRSLSGDHLLLGGASSSSNRSSLTQSTSTSVQPPLDGKKSIGRKKAGKLLRKIRSRSLLSNEDTDGRGSTSPSTSASVTGSVANISTDSLVSSSTRDSSTSVKGRWVNTAFEKAMPHWLSNKDRKVSDQSYSRDASACATPVPSDGSQRSMLAERRPATSSNTGTAALGRDGSSDAEQIEILSNDVGEPLPRRLSGWILNVLGNDHATKAADSDKRSEVGDTVMDASVTTPHRSDIDDDTSSSSRDRTVGRRSSLGSLVTAALPKPSSKSPGLLSTFSSSARARAAAAVGTVAPAGALDILRGSSEEDIWLLGVRHGPQGDEHAVSEPSMSRVSSPATRHSASPSFSTTSPLMVTEGNRRRLSPASISSVPSIDSTCSAQQASVTANNSISDDKETTASHDTSLSDLGTSFRSMEISSTTSPAMSTVGMPMLGKDWKAEFQHDFSSRIWCSYRSHFPPISRDGTISDAAERAAATSASVAPAAALPPTSVRPSTPDDLSASFRGNLSISNSISSRGGWLTKRFSDANTSGDAFAQVYSLGGALGLGAPSQGTSSAASSGTVSTGMSLSEKMGITGIWGRATAAAQAAGLTGRTGLTTDAGWGCMLRTGQSLLANALIDTHLGRIWRRNLSSTSSISQNDASSGQCDQHLHSMYVQIITWFMDDPSIACPFGIHRMAREGKRLGKEVGEWFGPSTAAGAIKKLVDEFPQARLGVSLASDGVVYLSEVRREARLPTMSPSPSDRQSAVWNRPVLILIGLRLGLEGVNVMYHDAIKAIFTFPQSVGIAGGRPSSSYYFVGYQGNALFYLDPHTVRPAVPFRHPPPGVSTPKTSELTPRGEQSAQQDADDWWSTAYSDAELATFHCDRPKRMPMRSLDPSMLLGFLVKDESSLLDFTTRVRALPRAIFAIQDELPRWMRGDDEDDFGGSGDEAAPSLESFSESSLAADDDDDDHESTSRARESFEQCDIVREGGHPRGVEVGSETLDAGYASDETRPIGRNTSRIPNIQISSATPGKNSASSSTIVSGVDRQVFPLMRSSSMEWQTAATKSSSGESGIINKADDSSAAIETPRTQSDRRFPSTTSTATARRTSEASTAHQGIDHFISISRTEASEHGSSMSTTIGADEPYDPPSSPSTISPTAQHPRQQQQVRDAISSSGAESTGSATSFPFHPAARRPRLPASTTDNSVFGTSWEEVGPSSSSPLEGYHHGEEVEEVEVVEAEAEEEIDDVDVSFVSEAEITTEDLTTPRGIGIGIVDSTTTTTMGIASLGGGGPFPSTTSSASSSSSLGAADLTCGSSYVDLGWRATSASTSTVGVGVGGGVGGGGSVGPKTSAEPRSSSSTSVLLSHSDVSRQNPSRSRNRSRSRSRSRSPSRGRACNEEERHSHSQSQSQSHSQLSSGPTPPAHPQLPRGRVTTRRRKSNGVEMALALALKIGEDDTGGGGGGGSRSGESV